jgi:hypothetical protein
MSSAMRQRRYRERQKCGEIVIPVPLDSDAIQRLIGFGYLLPEAANNRQAIGEAAAEFMDHEFFRGCATVTGDAAVANVLYHLAAEDDEEPT